MCHNAPLFFLVKDLKNHYSIVQLDNEKYSINSDKEKKYRKAYEEERLALDVYTELVFAILRKRDLRAFPKRIATLADIAKKNKEFKFNLWYRLSESARYQHTSNWTALIHTCRSAIQFFKTVESPLPYTTQFIFHDQLIPLLIRKKAYPKAAIIINKCLELPTNKGVINWHISLIHKATLGFYTGKPLIAYEAYKLAQKTPKNFSSPRIEERWLIIKSYLILMRKIGLLQIQEHFRIGRFLNSVPNANQEKGGNNIAVLIIKLLHYLVDGRKRDYMATCEILPKYIQSHLRNKVHIRNRAALRIMCSVEAADYHPFRFELKAKKQLDIIKKSPAPSDISFLECEVIPFENMIELIQGILKK